MRRRAIFLAVWAAALGGCAPTAQQQADALTPTAAASRVRAEQSRRFDTSDMKLMLQSAVGTLQDLGYTIEETQAEYGIIVGSKIAGDRIRAQIVLQPVPGRQAVVVRAMFQSIAPRRGAMPAVGEALDDPSLYRDFFEKLAQSAFLTAHEI